ncbi:potassium channel family protein [Streptomyces sp. NPDC048018]|uniref:potassium channel family protein n=1 Tax=Streptomyces sp. NPDC048018 TaxID=3365499 RepID=UPI003720F77A
MTPGGEAVPEGHLGPPARRIVWTVVRVVVSVTALVALYYLLPLDHSSTATTLTMLLVGLAGFVALVSVQVRSILHARHPGLRAAEAMAISIPFFLLLFSASYVALSVLSPGSFRGPLSHTEALYFTVTVFSTVGFGDITAKDDTARLVVTVQMLADLVVLGLAVKIFVGAVRRGRRRRTGSHAVEDGGERP